MNTKIKQFSLLGNRCWINHMKQEIENKKKNKKTERVILMSPWELKNNH